ncbi:MAG: ribosome silencing factor [Candidatus Dadabacteria bacterium]|nr:MAG: ribosome silencing factor [Candidatus Dadabacteria bacterium]
MTDEEILERVMICAAAAAEKRGADLAVLDVRKLAGFTDYFLIVSGSSDRRVQSIAEGVLDAMKERGVRPLGVEGIREGRWALLDFGDWVVHVFYEDVRQEFGLEDLWFDAPRVPVPEEILHPKRESAP